MSFFLDKDDHLIQDIVYDSGFQTITHLTTAVKCIKLNN